MTLTGPEPYDPPTWGPDEDRLSTELFMRYGSIEAGQLRSRQDWIDDATAIRKVIAGDKLIGVLSTVHVSTGDTEAQLTTWNDGFDEGWSQAWSSRMFARSVAVLAGALLAIGLLVGFAFGQAAAPRSAQVNPSGTGTTATTPELSGVPSPAATFDVRVQTQPSGGAPTPRPTGGIGQPASYCKPGYCQTPPPLTVSYGTPDDGIAGQATWWNSFGGGYYAAIRPDLGSKGDLAIVCGGWPFHCRSVEIITTCACLGPNSDRLIDLSLDTFVDFAPPGVDEDGKPRAPGWQGTIRVTLQVVER